MLSKHCGNCKHYESIEKSRTGYCRKSGCDIEGKVINARRPSATRCFEPRRVTNADQIRSMTDEQIADLLLQNVCNVCDGRGSGQCGESAYCACHVLEWLTKEADDSESSRTRY